MKKNVGYMLLGYGIFMIVSALSKLISHNPSYSHVLSFEYYYFPLMSLFILLTAYKIVKEQSGVFICFLLMIVFHALNYGYGTYFGYSLLFSSNSYDGNELVRGYVIENAIKFIFMLLVFIAGGIYYRKLDKADKSKASGE